MRCRMITTNAQHLGIPFFEPAIAAPERNGLLRSSTGKVQHVEGEDDMLLPLILAQANIAVMGRRQSKIRGAFADFSWHDTSFQCENPCTRSPLQAPSCNRVRSRHATPLYRTGCQSHVGTRPECLIAGSLGVTMAGAHRHPAGGLIRPDPRSYAFTHKGITIMKYGDMVEIGINGIVVLRNPVVREQ